MTRDTRIALFLMGELVAALRANDPALLDAWLHGRLDVDIAGAFFGSSYGVRRSLRDLRPGGIQPQDLKRAFVAMDWGCSAPTVAYLCLPESTGTPKGSIWLLDEFYVAASTAGGQRDWTRLQVHSDRIMKAMVLERLEAVELSP